MDRAHKWTDDEIRLLESRISREYGQAVREMRAKSEKFLEKYERELAKRRAEAEKRGEIDGYRELREWMRGQTAIINRMNEMVSQLSEDTARAADKAAALVEDALPGIYAENANWAAFEIDRAARLDTRFTLMDESTAREVIGRSDRLFEPPRPDSAKVMAWTDRKLTSAVTQGLLQGESIPHIADRMAQVYGSNRAAAIRAARTACTGAENAGRVASYERAEDLGIKMQQEWMATLDDRTRYSHAVLDGERVDVGEVFHAEGGDLRFPGDPQGPPEEVYNCRCTLVAAVDGIDQSTADRFSRLPDGITYDEWKQQARDRLDGIRSDKYAESYEPVYGEYRGLSYVDDHLGSHWGDGSDLDPRRMIMEDTGFSEERAEQTRRDVSSWVGTGYTRIRAEEGTYAQTAERLEEFIAVSPKYEGTVYRGIGVDRDIADEILSTLRGGGSIDNHGIASWATESDWATEFASANGEHRSDPVSIVLQLDENRSGVSIKHIADIDNDEVIAPKGIRYELDGSIETIVDPYEGEYILVHVKEALE